MVRGHYYPSTWVQSVHSRIFWISFSFYGNNRLISITILTFVPIYMIYFSYLIKYVFNIISNTLCPISILPYKNQDPLSDKTDNPTKTSRENRCGRLLTAFSENITVSTRVNETQRRLLNSTETAGTWLRDLKRCLRTAAVLTDQCSEQH
jgi:hypothetical protein